MSDRFALDKRQMRRAFERAASGYDAAAALQREVCARMLERLSLVRISPRVVLDAGSGTGNALTGLSRRYPQARVIELDISHSMLRVARSRQPWWRRVLSGGMRSQVCGDIERLPLGTASIDLLWSNLSLQWSTDLGRSLAECFRVLKPEGLLMFSSFGPDTLKELRAAFEQADRSVHVNRFIDMHDVGDLLVHAGFSDPVMDAETFTLTYREVADLMRELKALGAHNVNVGRSRGLSGRRAFSRLSGEYEKFRLVDGRLPATFEVVYGHAWKPRPRTGPGGRAVIDIRVRAES
ncbi:MAG: malonyl-ACP O-methyltransferase BioC [Burkholderiales bacterium]